MYFQAMEEWHNISCPYCGIGLDVRNYDERLESETDTCPNCSMSVTVEYNKDDSSYFVPRAFYDGVIRNFYTVEEFLKSIQTLLEHGDIQPTDLVSISILKEEEEGVQSGTMYPIGSVGCDGETLQLIAYEEYE